MISSDRVTTPSDRRSAHFRAHERRVVQLQASLWHPGNPEPAWAQVVNLGLAGAGIACPDVLHQEDRVVMTLLSASLLDPLVLPARVAWVDVPPRPALVSAGLAFELPERSALLTLFQLIATLSSP